MIEDLRHFRQDRPTMVRVAVTLWITFFVLAPITAASVASLNAAPQAPSSSYPAGAPPAEPAEAAPSMYDQAMHFAGIVAGCKDNGHILWTDPMTGMEMVTICKTYEMGRMPE